MPRLVIDQSFGGGDSGPFPRMVVQEFAEICRAQSFDQQDSRTSKWFIRHLKFGAQPEHMGVPETFNHVFRDGKEYLSVFVTEDRIPLITAILKNSKDGDTTGIRRYACFYIGREFDIARCSGINMRKVGDRIEIRLAFDPPWYFNQLVEMAREQAIRPDPDPVRPGGIGQVPSTPALAGEFAAVPEPVSGGVRYAPGAASDSVRSYQSSGG